MDSARAAGVTVSPAMPVNTDWITPQILRNVSAAALDSIEAHGMDFGNQEALRALFPDSDGSIGQKTNTIGMEPNQASFMARHVVYAIATHICALRANIAPLHGLFCDALIREALVRLQRPEWWDERDRQRIVEKLVKERAFELYEWQISTMSAQDIVALHWFFAWREHTKELYFMKKIRSIEEAIAWSQEAIRDGKTAEEATRQETSGWAPNSMRLGWRLLQWLGLSRP